jgi:DNA mismatch repair ATPase MutS
MPHRSMARRRDRGGRWAPSRPTAIVSTLLADLRAALVDQPGHLARDGGFVAPGWSHDLDEARTLRDDSRKVIADLEATLAD